MLSQTYTRFVYLYEKFRLGAFPVLLLDLPSAMLSSILASNVGTMTEAESDGLEATAGVYHGDSGSGTTAAERVPGDGKSSSCAARYRGVYA